MNWLDRLVARTAQAPGAPQLRTALVTDSAAALPVGWLADGAPAAGVTIVSMPVIVSGRTFGEGVDELSAPLTVALAQGSEVRTSRPSPGQFESVYRRLEAEGFEDILSIHLSGLLSGTVEAASMAARSVSIPVTVVDSLTVGMALGYGIAAAAQALRDGHGADGAAAAARAACGTASLYFYVPSLEQLRRGGRIGAAAGLFGSLLSVKPLLKVSGGRVVPLEKVRSASRALQRLDEIVAEDMNARPDGVQVAFHYFGNAQQVQTSAKQLGGAYPGADVVITRLPAVLAAHTGLGVVGVAVADPLGPYTGPSSTGA